MLHLCGLTSGLLVGAPAAPSVARAGAPTMMPKFIKEIFPDMEKPDFSAVTDAFSGLFPAPPPPIEVKEPSSAITSAAQGMPLLAPVFGVEADVQAAVTNLGSYDADEVQAEIKTTVNSAPC